MRYLLDRTVEIAERHQIGRPGLLPAPLTFSAIAAGLAGIGRCLRRRDLGA